jgi:hypothetical protein
MAWCSCVCGACLACRSLVRVLCLFSMLARRRWFSCGGSLSVARAVSGSTSHLTRAWSVRGRRSTPLQLRWAGVSRVICRMVCARLLRVRVRVRMVLLVVVPRRPQAPRAPARPPVYPLRHMRHARGM